MIRTKVGRSAPPGPYRWRGGAAAATVSLLAHSLLLLGLVRSYRPVQLSPPRQEPARQEVVYLDLPALPPAPPVLRAPGGPASAGPTPEPTRGASALSRRTPEAAARSPSPARPDGPGAASAEAAPSPGAAGAPLRGGFRDSRLYVDARDLPQAAPRPAHERIGEDARAALRAHQDSVAEERRRALAARQVVVGGRKVTVAGDSTAYHRNGLNAAIAGQRMILPGDGREWRDLQLKRQEQAQEHDRIFQERVRATRARKGAERGAAPRP